MFFNEKVVNTNAYEVLVIAIKPVGKTKWRWCSHHQRFVLRTVGDSYQTDW
jgi:hypothetical protein